MLFKCKDTSFFSNMEGFLIFFCNFACKFKGICPNGERKSPISGRKFPIGRVSRSRYIVFSRSKYTVEFKNKIYN